MNEHSELAETTDQPLGQQTQSELEDQPAAWKAAAALLPAVATALPTPGARVAVVGCGTSYYMGGAYAELRERAGHGETDAFVASRLPTGRRYDALLAISRSGTTRDLVDVVAATTPDTRRIAITATPSSPLVEAADVVVDLAFADERSVVQTRFATTGLALLRGSLDTDLGSLVQEADDALQAPLPAVGPYDHFVFLGRGWASWLATEAALKMREMTYSMTEGYLDVEYEHGPVSVASPQDAGVVTRPAGRGGPGLCRPDGRSDRRSRPRPDGRTGPRAPLRAGARAIEGHRLRPAALPA